MKQTLRFLVLAIMSLCIPMTFTACGGGDSDEPVVNPEPGETYPTLTQKQITGTWINNCSNNINFDYYAFDGMGSGMYSIAADQYRFECFNEDGTFSLVRFKYTIEDNTIFIVPATSQAPFSLTISEISNNAMKGSLNGLSHFEHTLNMSKKDNSYDWLTLYGPPSIDLTSDLTGTYDCDQDPITPSQATVEKVNNYTLKISRSNSTVTGYLSHDQWKKGGERYLYNADNPTVSSSYYFTEDGKLHRYGSNYTYTKRENGNQGGDPQESSKLAGTNWSGTIDGDYVELYFKDNGTFIENYAGDSSTSTYLELDDSTIIIGDGTVMYNTFGANPFNFELSANKSTLTFSNKYDTWTFKRKL